MLGDRPRHHRRKLAVQASASSPSQTFQQGLCVCGGRVAWLDRHRVRHVNHVQPRIELALIADDDYAVTESGVEKRIAEFRADAGRLTSGYDEWLALRHT
jgi:hypothetical protein